MPWQSTYQQTADLTSGKKGIGAFELQEAVNPDDVTLESDVNCTRTAPRLDVMLYGVKYEPLSSATSCLSWQLFAHSYTRT